MPRVSVVVVNCNGKGLILSCLHSLAEQTLGDSEVFVVDNCSYDNSLCEVYRFIEADSIASLIRIIPLDKNIGFAGGNIEGLKHTSADYVALLNPDAVADSLWLEELVNAMELNPEVGICASKMIVYGKNIIDSAGDGYATSLKGFKRGEGENVEGFSERKYVFGACAGAALYRRKMIEEIGFLDRDFFLIHEDTDINFRAQLAGWKVLYVPSAIVYHRVGSSVGHASDRAIYYALRNSELVRMKNVSLGVFVRCIIEFIAGFITEFIRFAVINKKVDIYVKAKIDALRLLTKMLKKRREIMKMRKVPDKYIVGMMTPVWQRGFQKNKLKEFLGVFHHKAMRRSDKNSV